MDNDTRTFDIYDDIEVRPVSFQNRFGFELAGHLYLPENYENIKNRAIAVAGPFGGVKEMASGLYAQEFAKLGFVAMAFDQSFTGDSQGNVRNTASPDINTEDYMAAVDYLGSLSFVDRNKIGLMGICGMAGMALSAAAMDTRIKAVATASMYDLSRSISQGMMDSYTEDQKNAIRDFLSENRWNDVDSGEFGYGPHEIPITEDNKVLIPMPEPAEGEEMNPIMKRFLDYYLGIAMHPNEIASWTQSTPMSFINFPLMQFVEKISPRPVLCIVGENAHSRYFSEDIIERMGEPKELYEVADADHVDMYYNKNKIPFDKLNEFFRESL